MAVPPTLLAAVLCLLPGMGTVFWFLRKYEGYFDERRVFLALTVGLFGGSLLAFLELFFAFNRPEYAAAGFLFTFSLFVVGNGLVESLGSMAVLASKRFRGRKDTPYYGVPLGVAIGAMIALQTMARELTDHQDAPSTTAYVWYAVVLFALCIGMVLTTAVSAVWIGRGVANKKVWTGVLQGTLWSLPIQAARFYITPEGAFLALGFGILAAVVTQRRVLETIVPQEIRDQLRRAKRREQRKAQ